MSDKLTHTFANLAADGSTATLELPGDVNVVDVYFADGADDGTGTLTMYSSFDGGTTWVAVPTAAWTSGDGYVGSYTVYGKDLKFTLASSTSPDMDITVKAKAVSQAEATYVGNLTDDGSIEFTIPREGPVAVFAKGTWDSGSLTLSHSPDGTLYVDSGVTAVTANGGGIFANACGDTLFKLVLGSVSSACDLDFWVYTIPA